jgi:hypothetical protein
LPSSSVSGNQSISRSVWPERVLNIKNRSKKEMVFIPDMQAVTIRPQRYANSFLLYIDLILNPNPPRTFLPGMGSRNPGGTASEPEIQSGRYTLIAPSMSSFPGPFPESHIDTQVNQESYFIQAVPHLQVIRYLRCIQIGQME